MKILLSAFACVPGLGSEEGIGWGLAREVARRHDVWVLTWDRHRAPIEAELARQALPRARFIFVPGPKFLANSAPSSAARAIGYIWWQRVARSYAYRLCREVHFDLVHHVTYANYWLPTWMAQLGLPFVWSTGIREEIPWNYLGTMSLRSKRSEFVRGLAHRVGWMITRRLIREETTTVLTTSASRTWEDMFTVLQFPVGALGAEEVEQLQSSTFRTAEPFRVVSIGRLLGWKGYAQGLKAFACLRQHVEAAEYWIVGEGSERSYLERLAESLGCTASVKFFGAVSRDEAFACLRNGDVLLHPSLRESVGYVVLEAMFAGKPVICLDSTGPAAIVPAEAGVKIPLDDPDKVVAGLATALVWLARNEAARRKMSSAARRHAMENWTWQAVSDRLMPVYQDAIESRDRAKLPLRSETLRTR